MLKAPHKVKTWDSLPSHRGDELLSHISDIVIQYDAERRIVYASPSVARYGYAPSQLIGRNIASLVQSDDYRNIEKSRRDRLFAPSAEFDAPLLEMRIRDAWGRWVWFEGAPSPLYDDKGRFAGAITTLRNISHRKAQESHLQRLEAEVRFLADTAPGVTLRFDADNTIIFVSDGCRMFGYEPGQLLGRNGMDLLHPDDVAPATETTAHMLALPDGAPMPKTRWRVRSGCRSWVVMEGAHSRYFCPQSGRVEWVSVYREIGSRQHPLAADVGIAIDAVELQQRLRSLTNREREVLDKIVLGMTNKEIARALEISWRTVEIHRARVLKKMNMSRTWDLVRAFCAAS